MRKLTCGIIGFLAVVFISGVCLGATIYVDQSGGGDYTTIEAGINAAYPDDIVKVGPGDYNGPVVIDKNIKLIGSGPKYTTIQSGLNGIVVQGTMTTEIANFTITAGSNGIAFTGHDTTAIVRNCVIVGCGHRGISSDYLTNNRLTFINNTIAYNNGTGVYHRRYGNGGVVNVQGNIIVFNGGDGLYLYETTENISYNNLYGNSTNYNNCSAGTGDISLNPLFIDLDEGNYALQSSSPSMSTGIPGAMYNNPDGSRNDMGAYAGPPSAAFWPYIPRGPVVTEILLTPASVPRGGTLTIQAKGRVQ